MCGRFVSPNEAALERYFSDVNLDWVNDLENFDLRPTQRAPVAIAGAHDLRVENMKWGLLPHWAKDKKFASRTINAVGETVSEKPSYRTAFKSNRCVVPMAGFYEWSGEKGSKTRHYIYRADGEPLFVAGLWARNSIVEPEPVDTFTVVTTPPNEFMAEIHDRMPVILDIETAHQWVLSDSDTAGSLISACPSEWLATHEVARNIGNSEQQIRAV